MHEKIKNFVNTLDKYNSARELVIIELKSLIQNYGDKILENNLLYEIMKQNAHIEKLVKYYLTHELKDDKSSLERLYKKAYNQGYRDGEKKGYSKGYDSSKNDAYNEGYETGYNEAYEKRLYECEDIDALEPDVWDED